jgi:hypothetical protein
MAGNRPGIDRISSFSSESSYDVFLALRSRYRHASRIHSPAR